MKNPSTLEDKKKAAIAEMREAMNRWFEITHDIIMSEPTKFEGMRVKENNDI